MSVGRSLPAWTSDLRPQTSGGGGLGQKAGPLTGSLTAGRWLCAPRHGHELTVMEFEKPKPDSVENLFLISGPYLRSAAKCAGGVGAAGCTAGLAPSSAPRPRPSAPTQPGPGGEGGLFQSFPFRSRLHHLSGWALGVPSSLRPLTWEVGSTSALDRFPDAGQKLKTQPARLHVSRGHGGC